MQVNDLGFVASILFVLVPAVFLIILYIQTASREGKKIRKQFKIQNSKFKIKRTVASKLPIAILFNL